jgi:precorrin-2 dehydrogenase / sirohydrochlorin ferrochelatase
VLPVALVPGKIRAALVGRGERALRRIGLLRQAGLADLVIYADGIPLPDAGALRGRHVVYIVGLDPDDTSRVARDARLAGALVNAEDVPELCDFFNPSVVRRGDLHIAVSTSGASPGLAKIIGQWLDDAFDPEWAQRVKALASHRHALRARGLSGDRVFQSLRDYVSERGWLPTRPG